MKHSKIVQLCIVESFEYDFIILICLLPRQTRFYETILSMCIQIVFTEINVSVNLYNTTRSSVRMVYKRNMNEQHSMRWATLFKGFQIGNLTNIDKRISNQMGHMFDHQFWHAVCLECGASNYYITLNVN